MSGPFGSSQWMYNAGGGFYDTEIDNALRFNDNDSAYLNRTPASAGNRKTWTWSGWVKRGNLGLQGIFEANHSKDNQTALLFENSHKLLFTDRPNNNRNIDLRTTAVFRDVSAWYHIVVRVDTTQATASNRVRLYVNGEQITSFDTSSYPSQNYNVAFWNNTSSHRLGYQQGNSGNYFDGYMSEVNFVDGQSLGPTSFGETKSGIWIPKAYSGSYGTNGFHLEFAGNSNDTSGNGNNWAATNISASDYLIDSPTNNFCTLNGVVKNNGELRQGNLQSYASAPGGADSEHLSTFAVSSGKWYVETRMVSGGKQMVGIAQTTYNFSDNNGSSWSYSGVGYGYYAGNGYLYSGGGSPYGASFTTGDIIGIALDMDNGTLTFYKNNVSQGQAVSGLNGDWYFSFNDGTGGSTSVQTVNFGQDDTFAGAITGAGNTDENGQGVFKYTPPSGYLAMCSANLPAPAIDPAADETPEDYFNTVLWSGNSATRNITGVGFQPDFTWTKVRNLNFNNNVLQDVVRGATTGKKLSPNRIEAEGNATHMNDRYGYISSFNSDGFTISKNGTGSYEWIQMNQSGGTYVGWNWKAGGTGVSNTDGSITSTVSANTKAGFSIVGWTATGSNHTVGHGLNEAPEVFVYKNRDRSAEWAFGHIDVGFSKYMPMDKTAAAATASNVFNSTAPTSSVFSVGTYPLNGDDVIAYCFHSVDGYSKFGKYIGNGSSDGVFVYTGFRPAWVVVKRYDAGGNSWAVFDNKRSDSGFNVIDKEIAINESTNEYDRSAANMDFLSNGFKMRNTDGWHNTSGGQYIYMAFAEQPFKYANAR